MRWLRERIPMLIVLTVIVLLGYPVALLFGLPLAQRDMQDLRKWERATIVATPVADLSDDVQLTFPDSEYAVESGILVRDEAPLDWDYRLTERGAQLAGPAPEPLVEWVGDLERAGDRIYRLPEGADVDEAFLAIYVEDRLVQGGTVKALEVPEGVRTDFTFPADSGPVLVDGQVLSEGEGYEDLGRQVRFESAPAFGSSVRRVSGDFGVVDAAEGLIVFAEEPQGRVRAATDVVRLAEVLQPVESVDGNRYRFAHELVVESDPGRRVYLDDQPLSAEGQRPQERVSGDRSEFTFPSPRGIVTIDNRRLSEGTDYERDGNVVRFAQAPERNARLRQFPDYFLVDASKGEIELGLSDPQGAVWAGSYTIHARPGCGETLLQCFFALPQYPVPFPNWIVERVGPFVQKYPLDDERNVIWATLYTTAGTMAALALGSLVGIVLAILFVLLRPLERALLPWVIASQTVPIIALVPVLLLILGNFGITIQTSLLPTAIIGAYIAFFPMVVGTVKGLRSVDPLSLDLMRSYAATPFQVFAKLRFPAAVPFFFTSLKLATAAALVGALVAETESNNRRGLGFQILGQVQSGNVADVWILLIVSALLGVGLVSLVGVLQRLVAPWERTGA